MPRRSGRSTLRPYTVFRFDKRSNRSLTRTSRNQKGERGRWRMRRACRAKRHKSSFNEP